MIRQAVSKPLRSRLRRPYGMYRGAVSRFVLRSFGLWERLGFHVTLNHFYQPVPDTSTLPRNIGERQSALVGIDLREQMQLDLLAKFSKQYQAEHGLFPRRPTDKSYQYYLENGLFGPVDAEILYCMIRRWKPRRVLEVGSGYSTCLAAQALLANQEETGELGELIAIEPYPRRFLVNGFPGFTRLVVSKVQDVPLNEFAMLNENDILSIDSSHILKTGSDVQYEYMEILPRLNRGVIVQIHDICLPYEYPDKFIFRDRLFFNEQYVLQAFLTGNHDFEVMWASLFMHRRHSDQVRAAFASYDPKLAEPASFWIRRVGECNDA